VRGEAIVSNWRVPAMSAPYISAPLRAASVMVEGRYKIRPRLYAAARVDRLDFSDVAGTTRTAEWDAPVNRVEVGGGYSLQRNLQLKMSYQHNTRARGRTKVNLSAAQLVFWF
jgi:predicted porin